MFIYPFQVYAPEPKIRLELNSNLCRSTPFPAKTVCQVCYREEEIVEDDETLVSRGSFKRTETLRYLYGVYTKDKVI